MTDLWKDGHIDCKDYALRNAEIVRRINATPTLVLTPRGKPNHVFVMFSRGGNTYVLDGDNIYLVSGLRSGLHKGIGIDNEKD